jgi:quinol monooxygenase YgiN
MSRVLFRVAYSIPDGKRQEYLALVSKLRQHYTANDVEYSLFEDHNKHNHFQEVCVYPSMEAYDASDDPENSKDIADVLDSVYGMATNITYSVAREVV